jgi:hypothetical protein
MARAKNIFGGRIRNKECPKALGVYNPSDLCTSCCSSDLSLCEYMSRF